MLNWLQSNIGNLLIGGMLLAIVTRIIRSLYNKRKKGGCIGCNGKCDHCPRR